MPENEEVPEFGTTANTDKKEVEPGDQPELVSAPGTEQTSRVVKKGSNDSAHLAVKHP